MRQSKSTFGARKLLRTEPLEDRRMLAMYPAYVDGVFTFGVNLGAPYGFDNTFELESLPGADKTIYLDFDGHHSVGNSWGHNIQFPPFSRDGNTSNYSVTEHIEMQQAFQNVAEDFIPFGINVTTKDPGVAALRRSGAGDTQYGVRAIATQPTSGFGNGIGGVALLNSFDDSIDNPVFAFNQGARNGGMTLSHEVGHALGLSHDGLGGLEYHPGTGNGATGWGPLMGAPFGKAVTQWSNGDYVGATTGQNDLNIITKVANGFTYRDDDFGNTTGTAHELVPDAGELFDWGIVERNTDVDYFSFDAGAGNMTLNVNTFAQDANLDVLAKLYDSNGSVLAESNPLDSRDASFSMNLAAGTYYVSVEGTGRPGRYSDYGSLGYYKVTGNIVEPTDVIDGDFNDDGQWDTTDIDMLVADIAGAGTASTFDLTGDGAVDTLDRDAWLIEAGGINLPGGAAYLLGDLDLDGTVGGRDFLGWNANKFTTVAAWSAGDFNADGIVSGDDFDIWNAHKFTSSAPMSPAPNDVNDFDYADPYGEAPIWPLGHYHVDQDHGEHGFEEHDHGPSCCCPDCGMVASNDDVILKPFEVTSHELSEAEDLVGVFSEKLSKAKAAVAPALPSLTGTTAYSGLVTHSTESDAERKMDPLSVDSVFELL